MSESPVYRCGLVAVWCGPWSEGSSCSQRRRGQVVPVRDARPTQADADAGVDVQAAGAMAQVKHWTQPVGKPPLRDLFGVAQAAGVRPVFYSYSGYTAPRWSGPRRRDVRDRN
ncbi:restriction endonuclease [Micromonospora chersina]|uniref:restriction endonuclease n=1 Tax=Micromonospora chersina TaxID=47854 RepID=UPI0033A5DDA1